LLQFQGEIIKIGGAEKFKVGFQYREYAGFVEELYSTEWKETKVKEAKHTGNFRQETSQPEKGREYQYRAFIEHPRLRVYGDIKRVKF
jgi:alpha-L-fucosidase